MQTVVESESICLSILSVWLVATADQARENVKATRMSCFSTAYAPLRWWTYCIGTLSEAVACKLSHSSVSEKTESECHSRCI